MSLHQFVTKWLIKPHWTAWVAWDNLKQFQLTSSSSISFQLKFGFSWCNITSLPLFANCSHFADTMRLPSTCTVLLHERSPGNKVYHFRTRNTQTLDKPDHGQRDHACSPSVSANFPISDALASLPSKNRRLVQINIPFLQRVSITFVLRKLDRNPIFSERTRDTIM